MRSRVKIKKIVLVLSIIFFLSLFPILINHFIINSNIYSKATNDGWASFLGSYLGGIFGGLATLVGVLITLKETNKQNIKPFLVIDFDEVPKEIYEPEKYSDKNSRKNIRNFNEVPSLMNLFNMSLRNTGKGYAKEIKIVFSIKIDDALVTDDNLICLSAIMPLNKIDINDSRYIQRFNYSYIGSEGDAKSLPLNNVMNGILMSSLWNMDNALLFSEIDFQKTYKYYRSKIENEYLTIPYLNVHISFSDMDNNLYESVYSVGFDYIYKLAGSYNLIQAKLQFPNLAENQWMVNEKRKKELNNKTKITRAQKKMLKQKKKWSEKINEFACNIGLEDHLIEKLCNDEALERYFYQAYEGRRVSLEELIVNISFCCMELIENDIWEEKDIFDKIKELRNELLNIVGIFKRKKFEVGIDEKNYNEIDDLVRLKKIIDTENNILSYYFKSYEVISSQNGLKIQIQKDGTNAFNTKVNIGNTEIRTELGFFRTGFTYRLIKDNDCELIQSVVKNLYDNEEIGFLDERGYSIGNNEKWDCIYLR